MLLAESPVKIILDINVEFKTDVSGRDPASVRETPEFSEYYKIIMSAIRDEI